MRKAVIGVVVLVLAVIAGIWYSKSPSVAFREQRAFISDKLRDPESTQFRSERIGGGGALCGELNSKNGSGGYAGFSRFISVNKDLVYLEGQDPLYQMETQEFIDFMDQQIKVLKERNALRRVQPSIPPLSEAEVERSARLSYFALQWTQRCT